MGNSLAKYCKADWIDGGRVKEKVTFDPNDQTITQYTDSWGCPIQLPKEYDAHLVKKLIRQRRLAPFYEANDSEDLDESSTSENDNEIPKSLKIKNLKIKKNKRNKDDPEALESSFFNEKLLLEGFLDCPICLLAFPRNTNYTECCRQVMCTACFVKLKRPTSGRVITCPFCNHANFSVCYHKPRWIAELAKPEDERDESIKPDAVACESVKVLLPNHDRARLRSRIQPRNYYPAMRTQTNTSTIPRRYVFYEPSGSYTFYDNQYYRNNGPPDTVTPVYYQHYQQQEYQRQQALQARAHSFERAQLDEAIRQSIIDSSEASEEYARVHR